MASSLVFHSMSRIGQLNFTAAPERPLQRLDACCRFTSSSMSLSSQCRHHHYYQRAQPPNRSWGGEVPDWDLEPYSSSAEVEDELEAAILGSDEDGGGGGGSDFAFQNILAAVLIGALALSLGTVLFKLGIVITALISAAFRYSTIGILIIVILALFS